MVNEALEAALAWCRAVPTRPLPEDVELVVTLGVRNVEVAREILFHDRERMRAHWQELRTVLDSVAEKAPRPSPAPSPTRAPAPRPEPRRTSTPPAKVEGTTSPPEDAAVALAPPADGDQPSGETSVDGFSPHYEEDPDLDTLRPIDVRVAEDGGLVFSWTAPVDDDLVRIYRVVTNNDYFVETPDFAGVRATYGTTLVEPAWRRRTRVHVSVFANEGRSDVVARRATARLLGRRALVLPVREFSVQEYEGTVVGQWQPLTGQLVQIDRHDDDGSVHVLPKETQLGATFHDETVEPGRSYEYAAYALATVDGELQRSSAVRARIDLEPELHLVDDLAVRPRPDHLSCDLEWTETIHVAIYQSSVRPDRGLVGQTLSSSALSRVNLGDKVPLGARTVGENRFRIEAARFIRGASTVFFTPVTRAGDQVLVGPSVEHITPLPVTEAQLVERVDEQFVTFAWPEGCSHVFIYVGGDPAFEAPRQPTQQVSRDEYVNHGGAHLRDPLPKDGCPVHLVGVVYSDLSTLR